MTDNDRRLLTEEILGECWHEIKENNEFLWNPDAEMTICSCRKSGCVENNRSFTTGNDMIDLKDKIVEMEEWEGFYVYAHNKWRSETWWTPQCKLTGVFTDWLMDEIRFPELVAGWWWQKRKVKG